MIRLPVIFLILFCTAAHSADLIVTVMETKTGRKSFFRVETGSLSVRNIQSTNCEPLAKIAKYNIDKGKHDIETGKLIAGGASLMKAENVLFQCSASDADFVVLRQEYNSVCTPLRILSAFSGHPVQVSKIIIVKIANGKLAGRANLTRRPSSYSWTATISQND